MAITKLPDDLARPEKSPRTVSEKKVQDFINRGGKPTADGPDADGPVTKSIKLIMTAQEMEAIKQLRDKRPRPRGRKLAMSVHEWVIEAIQEKIEREQKKYGPA